MDCLQLFVAAATQYKTSPNESNMAKLQRHIDILVATTKDAVNIKLFDQKQIVVSEFFAAISDFLMDSKPNIILVHKIIALLKTLANCDLLNEALVSVFHLYSPIVTFLQNFGVLEREPLVAECLEVLERMSDHLKVPYIESQMESLLRILLLYAGTCTKLSIPCIGILANVCRNNYHVRNYVKQLPKNKQLMKSLVTKVSDPNPQVSLQATSVLSMLRRADWGEKIFQAPNIIQTFELILYIMGQKESNEKTFAVKLLRDLFEVPPVRNQILGYERIVPGLKAILGNVTETKKPFPSNDLQFAKIVLETASTEHSVIPLILLNDESIVGDLLSAMIHWIGPNAEGTTDKTSNLAVQVLQLLLKEMLPHGKIPEEFFDSILELLRAEIRVELDFNSIFIEHRIQKLKSVAKVLMVLSKDEAVKPKLTQYLTADLLYNVLSNVIENYQLYRKDEASSCIDVVLLLLTVIGDLSQRIAGLDEVLGHLMQNGKFFEFLSEGFVSTSPSRIEHAFAAITVVGSVFDFPRAVLAQAIAKLNTCRMSNTSVMVEETLTDTDRRHSSIEGDISRLVQKMEMGLDVKEMKQSEIMKVYEFRICSLEENEKNLHELLDAKSEALNRADRLLADHKRKQAIQDGEGTKLRKLLQEAEEQSENAREEIKQATTSRKQYQLELEKSKEANSKLKRQMQEVQETVSEYEHKNFILEEKLQSLEGEYKLLLNSNTLLQNHNDTLKQKLESLNHDISNFTIKNKQLDKLVKEKEDTVNELTQQLGQTSEHLTKLREEYDALKSEEEHLKERNISLSSDRTKFQQEATSLGILCRQQEESLQEKDHAINTLKEKLVSLQDLNRMIHELSTKAAKGDATK